MQAVLEEKISIVQKDGKLVVDKKIGFMEPQRHEMTRSWLERGFYNGRIYTNQFNKQGIV